jgi:plastocyanin
MRAFPALLLLAACGDDLSVPGDTIEPERINGCFESTALDNTPDGAVRELPLDVAELAVQPRRCMRILVGQTVRFTGIGNAHPLSLEVTDPSWIERKAATPEIADVTFAAPGVYRFGCLVHHDVHGAIFVE